MWLWKVYVPFRKAHWLLNVDQVHLLPDALHRGLRAQRRHVGSNEAVRLLGNDLGLHVVVQLHVPVC